MAKRSTLDEDGFPRIDNLAEAPQLRDGFGRSQVSTNPTISGAAHISLSPADYLDPSLGTFRQGIRHWSRFNSIYRQVESMKRKQPTRTAPELLTDLMLNKMGVTFQSQVVIDGGKLALGGGVLDFIIPNQGLALNIHGRYYHTEQEAQTEWFGIIGKEVNGMQIRDYRYIWDDDLYKWEDGLALRFAISGIQL